jgi:hypothetical protein
MKKHLLWLALPAIMIAFTTGQAQVDPPLGDITPGAQVHATAPAAGGSIDFSLYAPPTYDNAGTKRWPLIIQVPPAGATQEADQGLGFHQVITCGIPQLLENPSTCKYVSDRFIVVSPFLHTSPYPARFTEFHAWIKWLYKTYKIDSTCVSFYGTCWGGNATYSYLTLHPEIASAAYLFAINDGWSWQGGGLDLTKACQLKNIAIKVLRGTEDCCTPLAKCKAAADAIHACGGGKDTFIQIPGPHEIYNFMDTISGMYDWFLLQKTTLATSVAPGIENSRHQHTNRSMDLDVMMTETERIEVVNINGKIVYQSKGNGLQARRMIPQLGRGLYLVKIISGDRGASAHIRIER